jgi:hypothetical protein
MVVEVLLGDARQRDSADAVTRHLEDQRALSWRLLDLVAQRWRSDELHVFTTEEKSS